MCKIKRLLILSFFLVNAAFANENTNINISNAWINEAPPTVSVLAAYATINNLSDKEQILISATSLFFSNIELHLSKIVNGMATMEKQNSLIIPAQETVKLSPGAYHLMLFDPKTPLKAGDKVIINFNFADGTSTTVETAVIKQNNDGHKHHH